MITVVEDYKDYRPPDSVRRTIEKLLSGLPEPYHSGLESVVLTNAAAVGRGRTNRIRGRKYYRRDCRGFYHSRGEGGKPWIEIIVDNVIADTPPTAIKVPLIREMIFADTLFHEVGHHLNATLGTLARGEESSAERWRKRLARSYFRKRYWYLSPLLWVFQALFGRIMRRKIEAVERRYSTDGRNA